MSESYTVKAEAREKVGKGAARHLRRSNMVPAVIYGDKQEALPIAVPYKETFLKLHAGGFLTTVITIDVGGKQIKVLPKDYQLDVVKDTLVHIDYLRVSARTVVTVRIPVHFENEDAAPGIKAKNGTLNIVHHDIEVICPPIRFGLRPLHSDTYSSSGGDLILCFLRGVHSLNNWLCPAALWIYARWPKSNIPSSGRGK